MQTSRYINENCTDTAYVVCGTGSMILLSVRLSVCLSVHPSHHSAAACHCSGLAAVGLTARRYCCTAGAHQQMWAVSCQLTEEAEHRLVYRWNTTRHYLMLMIFALQCLTETRNLPVYFFTFCTTLQKNGNHIFLVFIQLLYYLLLCLLLSSFFSLIQPPPVADTHHTPADSSTCWWLCWQCFATDHFIADACLCQHCWLPSHTMLLYDCCIL